MNAGAAELTQSYCLTGLPRCQNTILQIVIASFLVGVLTEDTCVWFLAPMEAGGVRPAIRLLDLTRREKVSP